MKKKRLKRKKIYKDLALIWITSAILIFSGLFISFVLIRVVSPWVPSLLSSIVLSSLIVYKKVRKEGVIRWER